MTTGRKTGRVLQVVGGVGLVVCIAAAIAVLSGRAWVADGVDQVTGVATQALTRGTEAINNAETRLTDRISDLEAIRTVLSVAAADSPLPDAIRERVSTVSDGYSDLRAAYADARAQLTTTLALAKSLEGRLPGLNVPARAATALAAVDERLTAVDARVAEVRQTAQGTVGAVTAAVGKLRDAASGAQTVVQNLHGAVVELQQTVDDASASVHFYLWLATGGVLLVLAWVGLLNVLVIWLARRP